VPTKKEKQPLSVTHPELAKEADGWDPSEVFAGYTKKLKWRCILDHSFESVVSSRTSKTTSGCPICANQQILPGFNDLATRFPEIAKEADGWDPSKVAAGSRLKKKWRCPLGHSYESALYSRTGKNRRGCPICSNQQLLTGFNDLATLFPEVASEADGWDPKLILGGSHSKFWWKCQQGHSYESAISSRVSKLKTGCAICAGKKILMGFNDLATLFPEVASEADGWDPTILSAGSHRKMNWNCPEGHKYASLVVNRTRLMTGCTYCSGKKVLVGFNDLNSVYPQVASEAYLWDPASVTSRSNIKKKWKCKEGHIWTAVVGARTGGQQTDCPSCAGYGFDPNADGYLYLLNHLDWEMFQIGITNAPDDRLARHRRLGWELLELRGPMDGHLTRQWETAILRMLKAKGADLSNNKIAGKFDGFSEAWRKSTFEATSIKELMRLTEEFESLG
jgi:hypothetical protein